MRNWVPKYVFLLVFKHFWMGFCRKNGRISKISPKILSEDTESSQKSKIHVRFSKIHIRFPKLRSKAKTSQNLSSQLFLSSENELFTFCNFFNKKNSKVKNETVSPFKVGSPSVDSILERFFRTVKSTDYVRILLQNSTNNISKMIQNDCLSLRYHILLQNSSFANGFHWILVLKTQIWAKSPC